MEGGTIRQAGIKMVRYADDFILTGKAIPGYISEKLRYTLKRMGRRSCEKLQSYTERKFSRHFAKKSRRKSRFMWMKRLIGDYGLTDPVRLLKRVNPVNA